MEKYFIFLDIDGTLWDNSENPFPLIKSDKLNTNSVSAVNFLAEQLKNNGFCPEIVVISKQREHWNYCTKLLHSHGLNPELQLIKLPIGKFTRGERISLLLHDASHNKNIYTLHRNFTVFDYLKRDYACKCNNYVVIDDRPEELRNIPEKNYIQTNIDNGRLKQEMVVNYLNSQNLKVETATKEKTK